MRSYYDRWVASEKQVEKLNIENIKLKKDKHLLQRQLQEMVNEIINETTTSEEDCPCGEDCGCKGDSNIEIDA